MTVNNDFVLTAEGINKSFGDAHVLKNAHFSLRRGEIHGLIGENGAGKSTLIKIISGDYTRDSGTVTLDGKQVIFNSPKDAIEMGIRVIHQEINVVKPLSVAENIFLGNIPKKKNGLVDWEKLYQQTQEVLDSLGEKIPVKTKVGLLPIAEQQIVEIAKALSVSPKVLIMDEPTAALNDQETSKLFNLLRKLRDKGVSIIYITHRFSEIYELTDRITVMRDGETVATLDTRDVDDDKLVKLMVGEEKSTVFTRHIKARGEEIFSVRNLNIEGMLNDVSFHVDRGEIVVIFGLFGAGQNELCRAIFGEIKKDSGEIFINKKKVTINSVRDAIDNGIGFVSDDRKNEGIIPLQTVKENISLAALSKKLKSKLGLIKREKEKELSKKYFDALNVHCSGIEQKIGSLSGGNQQKCVIGRWLANDAKVLLLNMPTRGVDVAARSEIYRELEALSERGVAIIVISLEMPEVLSISDRIYVMHEKRIVGEIPRSEATQEKLMSYALGIVS